jgi:hypothetical protein
VRSRRDVKPDEGKGRSSELTVALIAAAFGMAGVLAGGLITYVTSRAVQDREIERQEELELKAAKSAAAMERFRFDSASTQLGTIIETKLDYVYSPAYLTSRLATVDVATMLAHLDDKRSQAYAHAQLCLSSVATLMRSRSTGHTLASHEILALRAQKKCVDEGRDALGRLSAR